MNHVSGFGTLIYDFHETNNSDDDVILVRGITGKTFCARLYKYDFSWDAVRCTYCYKWTYTGHYFTDCGRTLCLKCKFINTRVFEYFRNPHPLLGQLTKLEYITRKTYHHEIRTQSRNLSWDMTHVWLIIKESNMPRDILRVIMVLYIDMVCREKRISWKYLLTNRRGVVK